MGIFGFSPRRFIYSYPGFAFSVRFLKKKVMSKILIIGVGDGGCNTIQRMKEIGIPDVNYITFGCLRNDFFERDLPNSDVPHYNLITMNGLSGISNTNNPKVFAELAENVKDQIKEIIKEHLK